MTTSATSKQSAPEGVVLIVDDDEENACCFKAMLETAGYATLVANNGTEAFERVRNDSIDCILMDVVMPGLDGVTLASQIKLMRSNEDFLPIVLVTAFANEKMKVAGLACADGFVAKPVSSAELIAIVRSLMKIRRLTIELARSKDIYKRFYENFPHMYISVKPDGTVISCNSHFCEFNRTEKTAIEGSNIVSFLRPDDRELFIRFLESVIVSDPVPQHNLFEFGVPGSGEKAKISVKAGAVDDDAGGKMIVIAMEDITKTLEIEEERKASRKQLYRSAHLASIGTLASGVAHEMNNPLTAIMGFSSALLNRVEGAEEIDKNELGSYLRIIYNETIRCRDIVDHLHRFARDSSEVRINRISLFECVMNALRLINMKAVRREITIVNEIKEGVLVKADANKLEQVFINLLNNCIDFCGAGATATIMTLPERKASKYVRVAVCDNGPGMTPEVLSKAFDPFFTTKEVGKGIGLGLAICHRIMEELNGRIDVVSEIGKGATILLEIPFDDK